MDRTGTASGRDSGRDSDEDAVRPPIAFPDDVRRILQCPPSLPAERVWDRFLARFGGLLLRTAVVAQRGRGPTERRHDAAMDAYTRVLERLRRDGFHRLRAFRGAGEDDLTRWLVVVSRRICTDLWRERYGRGRESTSETQRTLRRRLADELWETVPPGELPAGQDRSPEWNLRRSELRSALASALEALEPRDRLLLSLRFEDGLSARRIADLLGLPTPFHVYRRVNRLLASLRSDLAGRGIEDPDP